MLKPWIASYTCLSLTHTINQSDISVRAEITGTDVEACSEMEILDEPIRNSGSKRFAFLDIRSRILFLSGGPGLFGYVLSQEAAQVPYACELEGRVYSPNGFVAFAPYLYCSYGGDAHHGAKPSFCAI